MAHKSSFDRSNSINIPVRRAMIYRQQHRRSFARMISAVSILSTIMMMMMIVMMISIVLPADAYNSTAAVLAGCLSLQGSTATVGSTAYLPCSTGIYYADDHIAWPIDTTVCTSSSATMLNPNTGLLLSTCKYGTAASASLVSILVAVRPYVVKPILYYAQCVNPSSAYLDTSSASGLAYVACSGATGTDASILSTPMTGTGGASSTPTTILTANQCSFDVNGLAYSSYSQNLFVVCQSSSSAQYVGLVVVNINANGNMITPISSSLCVNPYNVFLATGSSTIVIACSWQGIVLMNVNGLASSMVVLTSDSVIQETYAITQSIVSPFNLYLATYQQGTFVVRGSTALNILPKQCPPGITRISVNNVGAIDNVNSACQSSGSTSNIVTVPVSTCNALGSVPVLSGSTYACQLCSSGSYAAAYALSCTLCSAGTFSSSTGASSATQCLLCQPGTYSPNAGAYNCTACAVGSYQLSSAASYCNVASAGKYVTNNTLLSCPDGTFNPNTGASNITACMPCLIGTYSAAVTTSMSVCSSCSPGSYASSTASTSCTQCPANTHLVSSGAKSISECLPCPIATPLSPAGSTTLAACKLVECGVGLYTPSGQTQTCQSQCPSGTYCVGGIVTQCGAGTYASSTGASACTSCIVGTFSTAIGNSSSSTCVPCPISMYSSTTGASICSLCSLGTIALNAGSSNQSMCATQSCVSIQSIGLLSSSSSSPKVCSLGSTALIDLANLLPNVGIPLLQKYQSMIAPSYNSSLSLSTYASLTPAIASTFVSPTRQSPSSLRMSAFSYDATLTSANADGAAPTSSTTSTTGSLLPSSYLLDIMIAMLCLSFIPLFFYRLLPAKATFLIDFFPTSHNIDVGTPMMNTPTQFGAVFTITFVCMSATLGLYLATASNIVVTTALVPHSASESPTPATGNIQITVRAYTGAASLPSFCPSITMPSPYTSISTVLTAPIGFSSPLAFRSSPTGQSCSYSVDCLNCTLSSTSLLSFTLPYNAQLIEWEVWISAAIPQTWTRLYGVQSQLPGQLLDAQGELQFTTMESFDIDHVMTQSHSGFENDFLAYVPITPQNTSTYSSSSTVGLTFRLIKSSIIFQTDVNIILTTIQIVSLVASAIVSLYSVFAMLFVYLERAIVSRRIGLSSGAVGQDDPEGDMYVKDGVRGVCGVGKIVNESAPAVTKGPRDDHDDDDEITAAERERQMRHRNDIEMMLQSSPINYSMSDDNDNVDLNIDVNHASTAPLPLPFDSSSSSSSGARVHPSGPVVTRRVSMMPTHSSSHSPSHSPSQLSRSSAAVDLLLTKLVDRDREIDDIKYQMRQIMSLLQDKQ